jgi:4-hydroxyphenylpyruvate dioxygenase
MGLDGFEFVEFSATQRSVLEPVFERLGFVNVARHRSKDVLCTARATSTSSSTASRAAWPTTLPPSTARRPAAWRFRVRDSHKAYHRALELGAQPVDIPTGPMELRLPAIKGIGGAPLYLIDRYRGRQEHLRHRLRVDRRRRAPPQGPWLQDHRPPHPQRLPRPHGLLGGFYEKLFNFREIRYFDIKGEYTGLTSQGAMTAPDGKIRIPLNEEAKQGGGPDRGVPDAFNGEGIQHIALLCDDLLRLLGRLQGARRAVHDRRRPPPTTRCSKSACPATASRSTSCKTRGILLDGSTEGGRPSRACCCRSSPQTLVGPGVLRVHPAQGRRGLRRGQLQGPVRKHGARPDAPRRARGHGELTC